MEEQSNRVAWQRVATHPAFISVEVVVAVVTICSWIYGWPPIVLTSVGFAAFMLFTATIMARVFLSSNLSVESIGELLKVEPDTLKGRSGHYLTPQPIEQEKLVQTEARHISLEELERRYEIKKLEPNLVRLMPEYLSVHNENEVIVVGEGDGTETFNVVIVPYYNSPNLPKNTERKISGIDNVSAEIRYRYFEHRNPLAIKRGAWLSEKDNKVNFGVKDTRSLIIATIEGKDEPRVYAIRRDFDSGYKGILAKREELYGDLVSINVNLFAEAESKAIQNSEFMLEIKREPDFKVTLFPLRAWRCGNLMGFQLEGLKLSIRIYEGEAEVDEQIIKEIKDWETRAANFIGQHLSEQQKTSFLSSHPSIEDGLQQKPRLQISRPLVQGQELQKETFTPKNWTLNDSINARTDKLKAFIKSS